MIVSDSTLEFDRGRKRTLYARFGIREYWVMDVNGRSVEAYSDPANGEFRRAVEHHLEDFICPQSLPQVRVAVKELFVDPDKR